MIIFPPHTNVLLVPSAGTSVVGTVTVETPHSWSIKLHPDAPAVQGIESWERLYGLLGRCDACSRYNHVRLGLVFDDTTLCPDHWTRPTVSPCTAHVDCVQDRALAEACRLAQWEESLRTGRGLVRIVNFGVSMNDATTLNGRTLVGPGAEMTEAWVLERAKAGIS